MKAKIRGTEIYYDIAGMQLAPLKHDFVEKPVLFMLHGGPGGNHLRYKHHSLELEKYAQLVFIDHRGCGLSKETKKTDYTLENNIEDIEALRKHLGLEKICILGTSYGGMVAQGYAIRYPQHVKKLILVVTAPSHHFLEEAKAYLHDHGTPKQIKVAEKLWNGDFKTIAELNEFFNHMDALYSLKGKKARHAIYSKMKKHWSLDAINFAFRTFLRTYDFRKKLKKIKCKTLVLAGDKDWICPSSQSKIIAKSISNATLKIFKNCGHSLAIDAHRHYIKAVKQFLAK